MLLLHLFDVCAIGDDEVVKFVLLFSQPDAVLLSLLSRPVRDDVVALLSLSILTRLIRNNVEFFRFNRFHDEVIGILLVVLLYVFASVVV